MRKPPSETDCAQALTDEFMHHDEELITTSPRTTTSRAPKTPTQTVERPDESTTKPCDPRRKRAIEGGRKRVKTAWK